MYAGRSVVLENASETLALQSVPHSFRSFGIMQKLGFIALLALFTTLSVSGQVIDQKCRGPIYGPKEVVKAAKLLDEPDFSTLYQAFGNDVSGRVTIEAVLCRSGKITDIRVIKSEPPNIREFVVAALTLVRFRPAELNWHTVSQRQQFEFNFNQSEPSPIDSVAAKGRVIEELDVLGNRRLMREQILQLIKTRAGDIYDADQVQKDLMAIVATGQFDSIGTRVLLDDAIRGGVRIIFKVSELPLITDIKFEGIDGAHRSAIIEELHTQKSAVEKGTPLDLVKLRKAARIIQSFLESRGWQGVRAEALIENLSATEVAVIFKVTAYKFGS